MLKEIKKIIKRSGNVEFPFKSKINDCYSKNKIFTVFVNNKTIYGVHSSKKGYKQFNDLDEAINYFMKITFTRKNIALIFDGIHRNKLTNKDFDDLTEKEIKNLVKIYLEVSFDNDYSKIIAEIK